MVLHLRHVIPSAEFLSGGGAPAATGGPGTPVPPVATRMPFPVLHIYFGPRDRSDRVISVGAVVISVFWKAACNWKEPPAHRCPSSLALLHC